MIDSRELMPGYQASIGAVTSGRYTSRVIFDYQEGTGPVPEAVVFGIDLSGMARGLGDQNGDGRTDQVSGDPVLAKAPPVTLLTGSREALARGSADRARWRGEAETWLTRSLALYRALDRNGVLPRDEAGAVLEIERALASLRETT